MIARGGGWANDVTVSRPSCTGAVLRVDSIHAYPGLIGATRPAA